MAKPKVESKVKHGVAYVPLRKALESLGDWRREVTVDLRPEVGAGFQSSSYPFESRRYIEPPTEGA